MASSQQPCHFIFCHFRRRAKIIWPEALKRKKHITETWVSVFIFHFFLIKRDSGICMECLSTISQNQTLLTHTHTHTLAIGTAVYIRIYRVAWFLMACKRNRNQDKPKTSFVDGFFHAVAAILSFNFQLLCAFWGTVKLKPSIRVPLMLDGILVWLLH